MLQLLTPLLVIALASAPDRAELLAPGLRAEAPWLSEDAVLEHATAAAGAETDDLPAELLLAIAYRESMYRSDARPDCGVVQVLKRHLGRAGCRLARSSALEGYRAGAWAYAEVLRQCRGWKRARRLARGVTLAECALNYYAEGGLAGRRGWGVKGCKRARCDRAAAPLARAKRIRDAAP